ncbi:dynein heavy chain 7, axonemal-like [Folsomia candida]|uniref:dynein heavy chain 7, axonemal-like n=1 Tax=Folsomia candida TaxID=158441 RepID=UPI001604DEBB|nr:dynein heavy chain 7, axonemal-like [Folsomia candida]
MYVYPYYIGVRLVDEYEAISEKALSTPTSTEQLFQLKEEMDKIKEKTLPQMQHELKELLGKFLFISDYMQISPIVSKLQTQAIQWSNRISYVMEEHMSIVARKALEFKDALKVKRVKLQEELDSYAKQVEEFQHFGNLEELPKYLKRAQVLDGKLQAASDKADKLNKEEEMFEFEVTNYPLRKQISDKLAPYLRLYESGAEFLEKKEVWLNSQVGTHDPELIENDVMNLWRTIIKLEKSFGDVPLVKELVVQIKGLIDIFKERLPIIQTLGNPGLRDRHWEKISEIVGFPIRPSPELTLQKIIDMNLGEYLNKFELISEAASKEHSLEKNLEKMKVEWADIKFQIVPFRESYVISSGKHFVFHQQLRQRNLKYNFFIMISG